ncbi:hypothetical protein MNEG_15027, partial [Monoraphidium neglectum]
SSSESEQRGSPVRGGAADGGACGARTRYGPSLERSGAESDPRVPDGAHN